MSIIDKYSVNIVAIILLFVFLNTSSSHYSQDSNKIKNLEAKLDSLYNDNELDKALKIAEEIIKLKPNDSDSWANKLVILKKLNRYEDQIEVYDNILRLEPDNYFAWANKGFAFCMIQKYSKSLATYSEL